MKKKWLMLLLPFVVLSACTQEAETAATANKPNNAAQAPAAAANSADAAKLLDSVPFTEEGLNSMFKTKGVINPEEFEALALGMGKCEFKKTPTEYKYANCPALNVYRQLRQAKKEEKRQISDQTTQEIFVRLLNSDNVIVRDFAFSQVRLHATNAGLGTLLEGKALLEGDNAAIAPVLQAAKAEKDPLVFKTIFDRFLHIDSLKDNPGLVELVLANAQSEHAMIRKAIPERMAAFRMKGIPEAPQMILDLCMKDTDQSVKDAACGKIFDFEVENSMQLAKQFLKDPAYAESHGNLVKSLTRRWLDFPSYQKTDAEAYKLVMAYLKATPRTEKVPSWTAIGHLENISGNGEKFTEWKKKASYYNVKDIIKTMSAIVLDPQAGYLSRTTAARVISKHGTPDDLKALLAPLKKAEGTGDKKASQVHQSVMRKIEEK